MGLKPDNWISKMAAEHGMIEPFVEHQVREGRIDNIQMWGFPLLITAGIPDGAVWSIFGGE